MSLTATLVGLAIVSVQCGLGIQIVKEGMDAVKGHLEDIKSSADGEAELGVYQQRYMVELPARRLDLLVESLEAFDYKLRIEKEKCFACKGKEQILFEKAEAGNYTALFVGEADKQEVETKAKDIYDYYTQLVQEKTYQTLLKRAKEKGYRLESETIEDNQSIKLSFVVGE